MPDALLKMLAIYCAHSPAIGDSYIFRQEETGKPLDSDNWRRRVRVTRWLSVALTVGFGLVLGVALAGTAVSRCPSPRAWSRRAATTPTRCSSTRAAARARG